ncbi:MAG: hypothetical protein PHC34_12170 [Candidatus Gastranaerophilales bacterium]|nr:hypothetical protein [Candidatus Gastranaerophilales bacterium]
MEATPVSIPNIIINQTSAQGNTNQNNGVRTERRVNNQIYGKFINTNAAMPIDMHVTSNFATLRVFPDDRNLYEILLGKEAKHKSKGINWYAAAGSAIGTAVPALIFYAMKFKKGKFNLSIIDALKNNINGNDFNSAKLAQNLENIAEKASSKVKDKLLNIAENLKNPNNDETINKLLKEVGLDKKEDLLNTLKVKNSKVSNLKEYFNEYKEKSNELYNGKNGNKSYFRYLLDTDEFSLPEILIIGSGSILGGLLGGITKENGEINKKKVKEANFQFLTNIVCPTILTERLVHKFGLSTKEFKNKISFTENFKKDNLMHLLAKTGKGIAAIVLGVGTGITIGSHVSNWLNKQYFKNQKYERKLDVFDVFIHVDDVPIALNFMKVPFMDKLLIFCSGLCGYKAGSKG